jgi:hypothetical protein
MFASAIILSLNTGTGKGHAEKPDANAQVAQAKDTKEMAQLREAAKNRKRRIIYNNDGDDIGFGEQSSPQDFLSKRIIPALNTQVDTIFYGTMVTTLYTHDTNVGERMDDLADAINTTNEHAVSARHNMRMLREAGTDNLALVIRTGHEAGLEVFWTHRINDTHDSVLDYPHLLSQWKRNHPALLMGTPEDTRKYPQSSPKFWWSTLDFEKPQVREHLLQITEDVARRYDVDGIEIDYLRYPMFFRPNLDGNPATEEQLDILTEFQRAIRQITKREGADRGRPILIAARVPMAVAQCRNVGIDIGRWLREDLLDLMTLGNGAAWPNLPAGKLVKLGHKYNVRVYPCLKYSGFGPGDYRASSSPDIDPWRGAASIAYRIGADGLYTFNVFPYTPQHPLFMQLGDPEKLATMNKLFAATDVMPYPHMLEDPTQRHCGLADVLPRSMVLPTSGAAGARPTAVTFQIGDDIPAVARQGSLSSAHLRVRLAPPGALNAVKIKLNGEPVTPTSKDAEEGWLTFSPELEMYRAGDNEVSFDVDEKSIDATTPVQVLSVQVAVKYGQ